jgi:transcriptional regulator with XRE-family HTH domain
MRQATLARKMGITPNGLNLLEHGSINDPHISRVITAAKIFQVSADFLLGLSDDPLPAGLLFAREGPLALQ